MEPNEPSDAMLKDFFYYTKTERRGIILLVAIVILCLLGSFLICHIVRSSREDGDKNFNKEYEAFAHSIQVLNRKEYSKFHHTQFNQEVVLASFNPNTVDSLTFLRLGLPRWMVHNILKYRARGGKFRKPQDFRKIYGMTDERFALLLPYIDIPTVNRDTVRMAVTRDSVHLPKYPIKYASAIKLELNTVDTTELRKIPGVGSSIARMIVRYRQQLGGYYSVQQLEEIHLISSRLSKWFTINPVLIHRLNVNKAGLQRLNAHPYINFYQAKAIVEYRRKRGTIRNLNQLAFYEEFTSADFERMSYYIAFD